MDLPDKPKLLAKFKNKWFENLVYSVLGVREAWFAWKVVCLFQLFFRCVSYHHIQHGAPVPFLVENVPELYFQMSSWPKRIKRL